MTSAQLRSFRRALLRWYDQHRRDLPWRHDRDPYRVWISEIMLQQTRVAAVLDHYARFLRRFPTVQALASGREASVLAVWSGLGYYHRARRMHQAAQLIVRERRGEFPQTAEGWLELPGIGRYTAAAIASIVFGQAVAVVDGNVERLIRRLFGAPQGRKASWQQAEALLDGKRPGDFNQAMMELGATICTPRAPQCSKCALTAFCKSGARQSIEPQIPPLGLKSSVEITIARNHRKRKQLYFALARRLGSVLLVRRPVDASLMAGMWELPMLDPSLLNGNHPRLRLRHSITDTDYQVAVYSILADQLQEFATQVRWSTRRQWERMPLTGLTRKILGQLPPESYDQTSESKCH